MVGECTFSLFNSKSFQSKDTVPRARKQYMVFTFKIEMQKCIFHFYFHIIFFPTE